MLIDLCGNCCHPAILVVGGQANEWDGCLQWLKIATSQDPVYTWLSRKDKKHCLAALDPYRLPDAVWVDDTSKWPPVVYLYSSSEAQIASVLNNEKADSPI